MHSSHIALDPIYSLLPRAQARSGVKQMTKIDPPSVRLLTNVSGAQCTEVLKCFLSLITEKKLMMV